MELEFAAAGRADEAYPLALEEVDLPAAEAVQGRGAPAEDHRSGLLELDWRELVEAVDNRRPRNGAGAA